MGVSNTITALFVYYLLVTNQIHYEIANIVAFLISSLSGFLLNRIWVFRVGNKSVYTQMIRYYIVYCSSLVLSMALSYVWVEVVRLGKYIAPLANLPLSIAFNYFFNRNWAFKK